MHRYFIIYKPYLALSQFSAAEGKKTLADFFNVPKDVYPVGRLDYDSEGLLILTNDTSLNHKLLNPSFRHEREYWVQVEGTITNEALMRLEKGVEISIDGEKYQTQPAKARLFEAEPKVAERDPPIRFRKDIPTSWIGLTLTEGKNRQVRRMTAATGFPTLRLVRCSIEKLQLTAMLPGDMTELSGEEIYNALFDKSRPANDIRNSKKRLPRK